MAFTIEPACICEMIPNHVTCSLKNPDAVLVRYAATIETMLPFCCLLPFVLTYHCEHRSGYKRRWTKNSRLEPPFLRDSACTIWEFRTWFFPGFFQSSTELSLKWPNKLSQFGHNVQNIRLVNTVNTVSISFNTFARKATERSQQKTGFSTYLLKNLWTTLKATF